MKVVEELVVYTHIIFWVTLVTDDGYYRIMNKISK